MIPNSLSCSDTLQLKRFLNEQLDEHDESAVLEHIDTCRRCQQSLEAIAANQGTWQDLKFQLAEHLSINPHDETLPVAERDRDLEMERLQQYLGPTDNPDMLGRLGGYEVCGLVGRGSTGVVVKALEPRLNRYVAIKILSPSFSSNGPARTRFEREGQAVAAVSHEHVVPIFAVDEYRGLPFIVMQYVPGGSLLQRIERQGPLQTTEVVRLGLQIARGLAAAHEQGIVHRDVKPANVMLESKVDRAMVTDFGLARVADEAAMTRSGVIAGTPQYMSPEQAKGEAVDQRSDLFSLGSVLYHACTGRAPFRAETVFGVIQRVCSNEPRPIREINPDIEPWLVAFIEKLHEKDRENRFASTAEVAEILARELAVLQGPAVTTVPERPWFSEKKTRFHSKKRWLTRTVAASIVAVATGLVLMFQGTGAGDPMTPATAGSGGSGGAAVAEVWEMLFPQGPRFPHTAFTFATSLSGEVLGTAWQQENIIERSESASFDAGSTRMIVVDADAGAFIFETGDRDKIEMEIVRRARAENEEQATRIFRNHVVDAKAVDGELRILANYHDEGDEGDEPDESAEDRQRQPAFHGATFRFRIPRDLNLNLETGGGHIAVADLEGDLVARTRGGHLAFGKINGRVDAETLGGNLEIDGCRNIRATTGGGNVSVKFLQQPTEDCVLGTGAGAVQIGMAPGLNFNVLSRTSSDHVHNLGKKSGRNFTIGDGGPELKVKTGAGNIDFYLITDEDHDAADHEFPVMPDVIVIPAGIELPAGIKALKRIELSSLSDLADLSNLKILPQHLHIQLDREIDGADQCDGGCDGDCDGEGDGDCDCDCEGDGDCDCDCEGDGDCDHDHNCHCDCDCDHDCEDGHDCDEDQDDCERKCNEDCRKKTDPSTKRSRSPSDSASGLAADAITEWSDDVAFAGIVELQDEVTRQETDAEDLQPFDFSHEHQFDVRRGGKLVIDVDLGSIQVSTHPENEVRLQMDVTIRAADLDQARALFKHIELEYNPAELDLDSESDAGIRFLIDEELRESNDLRYFSGVSFTLLVPDSFNIVANSRSGNVTIASLEGDLDIRTSGGSLKFGEIDGALHARTLGGPISLVSCSQKTELQTLGGSIRIERVAAETMARTAGGKIVIGTVDASARVRTSGGDITIDMINAEIDALTSGGDITAQLGSVSGEEIVLRTSSGDIEMGVTEKTGLNLTAGSDGDAGDGQAVDRHRASQIETVLKDGTRILLQTSAGDIRFERVDKAEDSRNKPEDSRK